jgi:hypothetical protein
MVKYWLLDGNIPASGVQMGQFWAGIDAGKVGNSFGKNKTNGWLCRQN